MELTVVSAISIIGCVISVTSFALNRKDKAIKDKEEQDNENSNQTLIDYRLSQVEKKLDKVLDILDKYDEEIDIRIEKAIKRHEEMYHSKGKGAE